MRYEFIDGRVGVKMLAQLEDYLGLLPDVYDRELLAQAALSSPLEYFCPNGKQESFINMVDGGILRGNAVDLYRSKVPVVLFTAANGLGKTTIVLHILANIVYGSKNGWFDLPLCNNFPFPRLCWYITTRNAIENVIVNQIAELYPRGSYSFDKR
ncbi:MAG: hypothetical protein Q8M92_08515, partial [Candidatus Subteraquimicrobiales bacterium]|nr:hypothetical protein [Candidatus Subteraquimicrobiales bacterium]